MDVKDRMKVLYNNFFTNTMCENERTFDVKSEFSADMSMNVETRMNTKYNTHFSHTMCDNERTFSVTDPSDLLTNMSMDFENRMNMQYNTSYSQERCENGRTNATDGTSEFSTNKVFKSHQDLIEWVKTTGHSLGYAIVTQRSKKQASGVMTKVTLMCNRGGIYKNKKSTSNKTSKKINCPFQLVGKYSKMYDSWTLRVKCEKHNHEPTLDMEDHPHANVIADADVIAVPAEDEPTFGRPFQPHQDLVLNKPQGPFLMSDFLEGDYVQGRSVVWKGGRVEGGQTNTAIDSTDKQDKVQYEGVQSDSDMVENGLQSDVNFNGLADIWKEMNVGLELNKSVDIEDGMNSQYNTNFTQTVCENERTYAVKGKSEFSTNMVFRSHQDLKHWVQNLGRSLGYVIVTKRSKKFKTKLSDCLYRVTLMCDRSGISKSTSSATNRTTKKTNCPFELVGKYWKMYNFWTLRVICEKHNHEPALDMEGHPYAQRLSDNENRLVVDLLKKNVKPQDILSTLKEKNPSNLSTLQTIYEARKKIRKTRHAETIIGKNGEASVSSSPPYTPHTFDANKMKQTVDHTKPFVISKLVQGSVSAKQGTFAGQVPMPCYKRSSSFQTDLTLTNPVKEVSNANLFMFDDKPEGPFFMKQFLEGDYSLGQSSGGQTYTALESRNVKDKNVCDFEINKKHGKGEYVGVQSDSGMEENKSSDVNYNGFADIWKNMTAGLGSSKSMVVKDRMNTQCDTESTRADDKNERQFPVSSTSEFCTDMIMAG